MNTYQTGRVIRELARIPSQIAKKVSRRIAYDIQRNFTRGVDPYGRPWKPLAPATLAKGRHAPPLTDTRAGRRSIAVRPTRGAGIAITVDVPYMQYHQEGRPPKLPKRSFLPVVRLPKRWFKIWQDELNRQIRKARRP